jgi:hypothetical protein
VAPPGASRVSGERQRDRDGGALARPRRARGGAAVRLGDGGDDREPEPDAAARPRAGRVGAVEALEDVLEVLLVEPRPGVA